MGEGSSWSTHNRATENRIDVKCSSCFGRILWTVHHIRKR